MLGQSLLHLLVTNLTVADVAALALLVGLWGGLGWIAEHPPRTRPSVTVLMGETRREWMRQYRLRDNRIFDAQIISSLRQGAAFFASTSLIAVGGVLALIGNVAPLAGIAAEVGEAAPAIQWQMRLVPPVLFLMHAFLKFAWSHRVFGYASVMMAAVPLDPDDPRSGPRTERAGELNVRASYNFNRGMRSIYFALASLGWLLGPLLLAGAALAAGWTTWSREFQSVPREILVGDER